MNFKKLIEDKSICEISSDNDFSTFDVGIIFHVNDDSIFVKCFGKDGEFSKFEMLPRDYIQAISYGTKYIEDLNIKDVAMNGNMNFSEWNCPEDVFEYLKKDGAMVQFYDYENKGINSGIIVDFDDDSVVLKAFDIDEGVFDGTMILNTDNYYTLEWGKTPSDSSEMRKDIK